MSEARLCPKCGAQLLEPETCRACGWKKNKPPPAKSTYARLPPRTPEQRQRSAQFARELHELTVKLCGTDHRKK